MTNHNVLFIKELLCEFMKAGVVESVKSKLRNPVSFRVITFIWKTFPKPLQNIHLVWIFSQISVSHSVSH